VAGHLGTEHHDSVVRPRAAELVETLLDHHDEPFGDSSALPTYLLAREARREVTVALNGDGGDEAFAGYERFHAAVVAERLPRPVRRALAAAAAATPSALPWRTARRLRRFALGAVQPLPERIFSWSTYFDVPALAALLQEPVDPSGVRGSYTAALARCPDGTPLSRLLYLNARTYLLDDLLPKMDRMTMAHGLEARSPLLDRALVEYAAGLPDRLKRRGRGGKRVLKEAARGLLPDHTLRRRKQGFSVPLDAWFRGELRPMVGDVLLDAPRLSRRLRPGAVEAMLSAHQEGRADHGQRLWTLLTLELWLRRHRF
jgi:asparagine synthase (glutamine-hydrolysing)